MFGGKPRAGLASTSLGELEDGVSANEQLLEVLGDKNKEEGNAEEVHATLVEGRITIHIRLGRQQIQCRQRQAQYHLLQRQRRVPNFGGAGGTQEQPPAVHLQRTN